MIIELKINNNKKSKSADFSYASKNVIIKKTEVIIKNEYIPNAVRNDLLSNLSRYFR